ncbi:hypothetical protein OIU84_013813 [Salix udensis]|uniref:Uncharacterized protein n=1 Tax=Salix udensis TaxID=889485 RepID=A0AAD6JIU9_9ROSI|nr:hypothetical protein OIU84_013813 [Salix udensis]
MMNNIRLKVDNLVLDRVELVIWEPLGQILKVHITMASINVSRTIVLENGEIDTTRHPVYDQWGVICSSRDAIEDGGTISSLKRRRQEIFRTPLPIMVSRHWVLRVINANYREFYHLVFENPTPYLANMAP